MRGSEHAAATRCAKVEARWHRCRERVAPCTTWRRVCAGKQCEDVVNLRGGGRGLRGEPPWRTRMAATTRRWARPSSYSSTLPRSAASTSRTGIVEFLRDSERYAWTGMVAARRRARATARDAPRGRRCYEVEWVAPLCDSRAARRWASASRRARRSRARHHRGYALGRRSIEHVLPGCAPTLLTAAADASPLLARRRFLTAAAVLPPRRRSLTANAPPLLFLFRRAVADCLFLYGHGGDTAKTACRLCLFGAAFTTPLRAALANVPQLLWNSYSLF